MSGVLRCELRGPTDRAPAAFSDGHVSEISRSFLGTNDDVSNF